MPVRDLFLRCLSLTERLSRVCRRGDKRKAMPQRIDSSKIVEFYKREDISRQLPNKRYARKEGPGYLMQMSLKAAFSMFKKSFPKSKLVLQSLLCFVPEMLD